MEVGDRLDLDHLTLEPWDLSLALGMSLAKASGRVPRGLGALWLPCSAGCGSGSGVPPYGGPPRARHTNGGPSAGRRYCPSRGPRVCGYFAAINGYSRIST